MRTTVEITDAQRAELLKLAAQRGEKGFSAVIREALDLYLRQHRARRFGHDALGHLHVVLRMIRWHRRGRDDHLGAEGLEHQLAFAGEADHLRDHRAARFLAMQMELADSNEIAVAPVFLFDQRHRLRVVAVDAGDRVVHQLDRLLVGELRVGEEVAYDILSHGHPDSLFRLSPSLKTGIIPMLAAF